MNKIVDIHITGYCNLHCGFCQGAEKQYSGPNYDTYMKTASKLPKAGVDSVVLTGGEPLLRKDIVPIIQETHNKGMKVYLSTNGLRLMDHYDRIKDYIACLGLPMDGSSTQMHESMTRGPLVFPAVRNALRYISSQEQKKHIVKVGTVVSAINKDDIANIGRVIYKDNTFGVDVWRLYQFSPLREGYKNKEKFEISETEFNTICQKTKKKFPNQTISSLSHKESDDAYFFINPRLELELLTHGNFKNLGNVLSMSQKDLERILQSPQEIKNSSVNRRWLSHGKR